MHQCATSLRILYHHATFKKLIISEVIASRIRGGVNEVVGAPQCTFVEGKHIHIHDDISCLQEYSAAGKEEVLKLDWEKAYYRVKWDS